jgi:pimeloyl-ACP methyl ester carboxylesterase
MNDYQKLYYSNQDNFLAYRQYLAKEPKKYGIIFLGGFKSDMNGTKAQAIAEYAEKNDYDFIRFDYFGHGNSSGEFIDGTIGLWLQNTLKIIDELTKDQPQILIGSSMGGWIMLLAALARPERIAGLIGLAAAPDFTEELIWDYLSKEQKETLTTEKQIHFRNEFCEDAYEISYDLINEARQHILLSKEIKLNIPVRLIHGMDDKDVPFQTAIRLAEALTSKDIEIQLLKASGHRLSSTEELGIIYQTISLIFGKLQQQIPKQQ